MMTDNLSAYLGPDGKGLGQITIGIVGSELPDAPDDMIVVVQMAGEEPVLAGKGILLERPGLLIIVRNKIDAEAERIAYLVWNALDEIGNQIIDGVRYGIVTPTEQPYRDIDYIDRQGRKLWRFEARVIKRPDVPVFPIPVDVADFLPSDFSGVDFSTEA